MTPHFCNWNDENDDFENLSEWVSLRIYGRFKPFGKGTGLAVIDKDGKIAAGMIYYDYDQEAGVIQISGASDTARWLTKPILWELFNFPFNDIKCQAVVMRVDPSDKRLSRILTSYGFEKYVIPRLRGRHKDEILYILYDDVWRSNRFHSQHSKEV